MHVNLSMQRSILGAKNIARPHVYWFCSFKNKTLPPKKNKNGHWYFFATAQRPSNSDYVIGTFSSFLLYTYHSVNGNFAPLAYIKQFRCWAMA